MIKLPFRTVGWTGGRDITALLYKCGLDREPPFIVWEDDMLLNEAVAMTTRPQLGAAILFIHVGKRDVDNECERIHWMWFVKSRYVLAACPPPSVMR